MGALLLTTKLAPPVLPQQPIHRPRLLDRLRQGLKSRLVLLSAPAGYGKTTLLGQWVASAAAQGAHAAWVSLDGRDNDPQRFWTYLDSCVAALGLGSDGEFLPVVDDPAEVEDALIRLINRVSTQEYPECLLVLDDYHLISHTDIHAALAFLLNHLPPRFHLAISTRCNPPLPLAQLRAADQLIELRASDLRFIASEAFEFFHEYAGLRLSSANVSGLVAHTEGWAAGLQLASISLRQNTDAEAVIRSLNGSDRYIADYLSEQVFIPQPPHIQEFLLRTSILHRLTAPLCDHLLQESGLPVASAQESLDYLDQANLFVVPLDNDRRWFRYHRLFGEYLRGRLHETHAKILPALHQRAAGWLERSRHVEDAVDHALEAQDYDRAVRLISQLKDSDGGHSRARALYDWMRALPDEVIQARPGLSLGYAWMCAINGYLESVQPLLAPVDAYLGSGVDFAALPIEDSTPPDEHTWRVSPAGMAADVDTLRAFVSRFRREVSQSFEYSNRVLERVPEYCHRFRGMALLFRGHVHMLTDDLASACTSLAEAIMICRSVDHQAGYLSAAHYLAQARIAQGQLKEAAAIYREVAEHTSGQAGRPRTGIERVGLGSLLREQNELGAARIYILEGQRMAEQGGDFVFLRESYIARARLELACGNLGRALRFIRKAKRVVDRHAASWDTALVEAWQARLQIIQGDLQAALHWERSCDLSPDDEPDYLYEAGHLTLARLLIATQRIPAAIQLLDRLLPTAQAAGRAGSSIEIQVLLALARQASGDLPAALQSLFNALQLGIPNGYRRVFLDEGQPLLELISLAGRSQSPRMMEFMAALFVERTRAQPDLPVSSPFPTTPRRLDPDLLSEREIQVIGLMARGLTYQQIAEELVIALSTVQTHVKNAYYKLEVHNSQEAVSRARLLNLLDPPAAITS